MHASKLMLLLILFSLSKYVNGQIFETPYEKSNGLETTTYDACIDFYKKLAGFSKRLIVKELGITDAHKPLHVVLYSQQKKFNATTWHRKKMPVLFVNNGIHAGEPDGIDASMLLIRDLITNKITIDKNIVIAIIPIYNIGGALNRNLTTRVNQNGPISYGFRGNSQNLDLNRDFIKCDSKEALLFSKLFHWLKPSLFLDTHVSDGADYQHTLTLLSTHHSKLEKNTGQLLHNHIEPFIYTSMKKRNWDLVPYVNIQDSVSTKGWAAFYDAPRYSTGYASLFNCIGFMSETHMLKPFKERVQSTYDLMVTLAHTLTTYCKQIATAQALDYSLLLQSNAKPTTYSIDSLRFDTITFKGYEIGYKKSEATGHQRFYYDKNKPFIKPIHFYNYLTPESIAQTPDYYIIPQGWHQVIERLKANNINITMLDKDSLYKVTLYKIDDYKSLVRPFEKHHKNTLIKYHTIQKQVLCKKGDYLIVGNQPGKKFLHAVLHPNAEDSYFNWNFFDAILQQKEGYSNYRWEDIAAQLLQENSELKTILENKKKNDTLFANDANAQLDFIYKNSIWYEQHHLTYPVYFYNK